jgi:hypothetical protein
MIHHDHAYLVYNTLHGRRQACSAFFASNCDFDLIKFHVESAPLRER